MIGGRAAKGAKSLQRPQSGKMEGVYARISGEKGKAEQQKKTTLQLPGKKQAKGQRSVL